MYIKGLFYCYQPIIEYNHLLPVFDYKITITHKQIKIIILFQKRLNDGIKSKDII